MGARRVYKVWTPYPAAELAGLDFAQTHDVVYFAHLKYPPWRLTRLDHTDWEFTEVTFGSTMTPPGSVNVVATQPNTVGAIATTYAYVVTAVGGDPEQESIASAIDTVSNDLSLNGNYNTITWAAVTGADYYTIYKGDNDDKGYIGSVTGLSFKDRNLQAIMSDTPPVAYNPFPGPGDYPSTVTFHGQRLYFARTINRPNAAWGSQPAAFENMDKARIVKPDDSLSFALLSEQVNSINVLVSMKRELLALTSDSIYAIQGGDGGAITPAAIDPQRQTGRGASRLRPIVIDTVVFYQPSKASVIRALGFTYEIDGYKSNNVSIFSPHLFDEANVVSWDYQEEPYSCIWACDTLGRLLCFTWEEEHDVWGWTVCETEGFVEQVSVITEGGYDRLYLLVRRTIAGVEKRFHERMALPHFGDPATACHLDCAVTQVYDPPQATVGGLWHLEGETVSAHYDGYSEHGLLVEEGQVTLPHEATVVTVGLRYEGEIETLPLVAETSSGSAHVNMQNFGMVTVRAIDTKGLEMAVSGGGDVWEPFPERDGSAPYDLPDTESRDYEAPAPGHWKAGAGLRFRQLEPFPVHITGIFAEVEVSET
jgi:hypothetical protein